ncbi:MAG: hypothetical protein NDJ89_00235 [Oligoflexia bacterium]|nr:hypothetical protein [Oligoflexia bacterium]
MKFALKNTIGSLVIGGVLGLGLIAFADYDGGPVLRRASSGGTFEGGSEVEISYDEAADQCLWNGKSSGRPFRGSSEATEVIALDACSSLIAAVKVRSAIGACPSGEKLLQESSAGLFDGSSYLKLVLTSDCVCKVVARASGRPFRGWSMREDNANFSSCLPFLEVEERARAVAALGR